MPSQQSLKLGYLILVQGQNTSHPSPPYSPSPALLIDSFKIPDFVIFRLKLEMQIALGGPRTGSERVSNGSRAGLIWNLGVVRGVSGTCSGVIWDLFWAIWDLFGAHLGSVRGPFGTRSGFGWVLFGTQAELLVIAKSGTLSFTTYLPDVALPCKSSLRELLALSNTGYAFLTIWLSAPTSQLHKPARLSTD